MQEKFVGNKKTFDGLMKYATNSFDKGGLILSGPKGLGKGIAANMAARRMLCVGTGNVDCPCLSCQCFAQSDGTKDIEHPDISYICADDKGTIGVEQVREVFDFSSCAAVGRKHIVIVKGMECMTINAQNAMLKTLEEQQKMIAVIGILNGGKILPTIVSRMPVFTFNGMDYSSFQKTIRQRKVQCDERMLYLLTDGCPFAEHSKEQLAMYERVYRAVVKLDEMDLLVSLGMMNENAKDNFYKLYPDSVKEVAAFVSNIVYYEFVQRGLGNKATSNILQLCGKEAVAMASPSYKQLEFNGFIYELCNMLSSVNEKREEI